MDPFDAGALEDATCELRGGVALVTLNRPHEGNAVTPRMHADLEAVWTEVKENPEIRCVIVTGAGERHFCTGASVSGLSTDTPGTTLRNRPLEAVLRISPYQNRVWKPVICAVNGLAAGAGLHFVVESDIVVAAESAAFMDTHTTMGQVGALENIGLARRMTLGGALLMTLVGRDYRMPAARAHQLGLVDLLEPSAPAALDRAFALADSIKKNSPQALTLSKQAIWGSMEDGYGRAVEAGWSLVRLHWSHPDFAEGPRAFVEKRAPAWNPDPDARR